MPLELFINDIGYAITIFLNVSLGLLVLWKGPTKTANRTFFLSTLGLAIFALAYIVGVSTQDSHFSQLALSFTMINIAMVCFNCHCVLSIIGIVEQKKKTLVAMYGAAGLLYVFFLTDTSRFLNLSKPKLYFPNFFEPGRYYWVFIFFFTGVVTYFLYHLFNAYLRAEKTEKNRLRYILLAYLIGYPVGSLAFLLTYNIPVDPVFSMFYGVYTILIAYGILKYDVLDIHIVAKRALVYAFFSAILSGLISFISYSNNLIGSLNPYFPMWLIPTVSSVVSVIIGAFVWEKIKEVDVLKYEFINNVTHKFRTPLTHIRWLVEDLRGNVSDEEKNKVIEQIQYASMRLFELTNVVIDTARDTNDDYMYRFIPGDLSAIIKEIVSGHAEQIKLKGQEVILQLPEVAPRALFDSRRLHFALQILFENALIYSPKGGKITLGLVVEKRHLLFQISDTGIGIPKDELPHLFSKFYRAQNARRTDTEGMGIGLFMSKNIIEKHHGKIWAESPGPNLGSTFSFTLPLK